MSKKDQKERTRKKEQKLRKRKKGIQQRISIEELLSPRNRPADESMLAVGILTWYYVKCTGLDKEHPTPGEYKDCMRRLATNDHSESLKKLGNMAGAAQLALAGSFMVKEMQLSLDFVRRSIEVFQTYLQPAHSRIKHLNIFADWYDNGMPVVEVGHKLAASYMSTRISKEMTAKIHLPFSTFKIQVPVGALQLLDCTTGKPAHVTGLYVGNTSVIDGNLHSELSSMRPKEILQHVKQSSYLLLVTETGTTVWRSCLDSEEVFTDSDIPDSPLGALDMALEDFDRRALVLAGRLAASVILHISGNEGYEKVGTGHENFDSTTNRRRSPHPTYRKFVVTRNVVHDMREAVCEYLRGNRKTLSVQTMVTGHWRWQPHGAGRALVKHIFIEPFWRGPEDAPIALRKHKLE